MNRRTRPEVAALAGVGAATAATGAAEAPVDRSPFVTAKDGTRRVVADRGDVVLLAAWAFNPHVDDVAAVIARHNLPDEMHIAHAMGAIEAVSFLARHGSGRMGRLANSSRLPSIAASVAQNCSIDTHA